MNTLILPLSNRNRCSISSYPSLKIFYITIIFTIILVVFYLFQVNKVVVNLYEISQLENQLKRLSLNNQQLEVSLSSSDQLINFSQLAQRSNFEKIDKISYIREGANKVVER